MADLTLPEVAKEIGVTPGTLRRWVRDGIAPLDGGAWSPAAVAQARLVARLRARGHSLSELRKAALSGRLAYGYVQEILPDHAPAAGLEEAAEQVGLEPALIERIWSAAGLPSASLDEISAEDIDLLRHMATVIEAGFPLVAFLQLTRVYGQAMDQIADAEVKLFHLYVHEPLIRDGRPGLEIAEAMGALAAELLPMSAPIMERLHERALRHFMEQDVVGHLEAEAGDAELGRVSVTIAFADLAGYTRMTEEQGDEEAVEAVERFVEAVEHTLPDNARIIKTIGDEVMVVGSDPAELTDWAVGFQQLYDLRPLPRIGIHYGETLYRDGDYYGREVNQAARVAARAAGGEVLVTRPVVESAEAPHLQFERIGEVRLKGFNDPTELFLARPNVA
jgi:adenylate cyclase